MTTVDQGRRLPGVVASPADMLARVDVLVASLVDDLALQWSEALDGVTDDVLGENDLPTWLGHLMNGGGKHIRPLMCHWGHVCTGDTTPEAITAVTRLGAALELLHLFALIHDDVMDEADTRRGVTSAHRAAEEAHRRAGAFGSSARYGESMAILLGDLAHSAADALVGGLDARIRRRWFELEVELIAGQREDLSGAATEAGGLARARRIARIKSGAYTITRPLQLGACAGGAAPAVLEVFDRFGTELGGVFATRDDILGVWGDPATTGKPSGSDLRQRKPTTMWVDASSRLDHAGRAVLDRVGTPQERPDDVATLQEAMITAGVLERAERSIADGVDRALTTLETAGGLLTAEGIAGLTAMTRDIAWRES